MPEENTTETPEDTVEATKFTKKKRVIGITREAKLTVVVEANPKRAGSASYDRFEGYLTDPKPTTVAEALEKNLIMGDIHYDFIHGSIAVEGATVEEYEPATRGPRSESDDAEVTVTDAEEVDNEAEIF